jgi:uncharacterized membrane protein YozB (DUF420 family)
MFTVAGTGNALGLLDDNVMVAVLFAVPLSPKLNAANCPLLTVFGEIVNVVNVGPCVAGFTVTWD